MRTYYLDAPPDFNIEVIRSMTQRTADRVSKIVAPLQRAEVCELVDTIERLRSQGKDILNLFGSPYWPAPAHVLEAAERAARENQVAPSRGFPELRQAMADKLAGEGIITDPRTEILVTNGAMHALSLVFTTLLDPGSEVLMYRPSFFFFGLVELAGAVPVYADTIQEDGWRWDAKALEASISAKTKMIVLNTPTNPTGYVATEDDLRGVADVARRHDLVIVSDESYDNMVYEPSRHIRIAFSARGKRSDHYDLQLHQDLRHATVENGFCRCSRGSYRIYSKGTGVERASLQPCGPAGGASGDRGPAGMAVADCIEVPTKPRRDDPGTRLRPRGSVRGSAGRPFFVFECEPNWVCREQNSPTGSSVNSECPPIQGHSSYRTRMCGCPSADRTMWCERPQGGSARPGTTG
jgi:hypothetical protein